MRSFMSGITEVGFEAKVCLIFVPLSAIMLNDCKQFKFPNPFRRTAEIIISKLHVSRSWASFA